MGRHTHDRSVVPPYDADLADAIVLRTRVMVTASAVLVAAEVLLVAAAAVLGPPGVRWWVGAAGRGGGVVVWDEIVPSHELLPMVLMLTLPGLALTCVCAAASGRRMRDRAPFRGAPRTAAVAVLLTHALAPGLAAASLAAWAGWGEIGALSAGVVPQVGTTAAGIALLVTHEDLDPWAWADPEYRRGRRARARWARRVARSGRSVADPTPVRD